MATWILGSATIYASMSNYSVDGTPYALAVGTQYAHLRALLDDFVSGVSAGGAALSWSFSGEFVRLSSAGAAWSLTWTDTLLRDFLGFTGNLSGNTAYTATNRPPFAYFPNRLIESPDLLRDLAGGHAIVSESDSGSRFWHPDDQAPHKAGGAPLSFLLKVSADGSGLAQLRSFLSFARSHPFAVFVNSAQTAAWSTSQREGWFLCGLQSATKRGLSLDWRGRAQKDAIVRLRVEPFLNTGGYTL